MSTAKYWPLSMSLPFIQFGSAELTAWLDGRDFTTRQGSDALSAAIFLSMFEHQTSRKLPPTKAAIDKAADEARHFRAEQMAAMDEGRFDDAAEAMRDAIEAEAKAAELQVFAASPARYDRQGAWQALCAALLKGEVLPSPGDAHKVASDKLPKDVDDLPDDFELFVDVASLEAKFGAKPVKLTGSAEVKCRDWLAAKMREAPDKSTSSKAGLYKLAATEIIGLGRPEQKQPSESFNRAWIDAIKDTGATEWQRAGRPRKKNPGPKIPDPK
jgi:hypothetical protein